MPESKGKKVPDQIKLDLDVKQEIEDKATQLTRKEGKTVTQKEVVRRAMAILHYGDNFTFKAGVYQGLNFAPKEVTHSGTVANNKYQDDQRIPPVDEAKERRKDGDRSEISEPEWAWIRGLLAVLRGKNELAKTAIMTNILAFTDYSATVPEVAGAGSDIDALEARLATLARMVDNPASDGMGGASGKQATRKGLPKKAGGK